MIGGQTVQVTRMVPTEQRDPAGKPILTPVVQTVGDVLVQPGSQNPIIDSVRPDNVEVAFTLHFPRDFVWESLRGATVTLADGSTYRVVGDPRPYDANLTPTKWNMPVEITESLG